MKAEPRTLDRAGKPYRLDVGQFLGMVREGVFPQDARIELIRGILVEHPKKTLQHNDCVTGLGKRLAEMLPSPWFVSEEKALDLARNSRVGPDIALIRGPNELYRARDPGAKEAGLLIEVAASTYLYDRGTKWRAYASASISDYWIVDLSKRQVEVYRNPQGRGKGASYRDQAIYEADAMIPVMLESQEIGRLSAEEVLP